MPVWLRYTAYAVAFLLAASLPYMGVSSRWVQLAALVGINVLLAQSMNIVGGYAGQVSLGQAGVFAAGAYGSAYLATTAGWPIWLSVPGGIVIAVLVGLIVALPAERVKEFYLGMVTLGFGIVAYEVLQYWEPVTGGFMGLSNIPSPTLRNLTIAGHRVTLAEYYVAIVALVALFTWLNANLIQSYVGRAFVAVSDSDVIASSLGVAPGRTKHLAYGVSAAWAGLAGALYAHLIAYISPESFNLWASVAILVMAVFGGFRTFEGPFLGAAFFTLLPEFTQDLKDYQLLAYGLILTVSYILLPRGIAGLWNSRTVYFRRPSSAGAAIAAEPPRAIAPTSLQVTGLVKHFGGLQALGGVDLNVKSGTIHGLLGPNGSGKSTLVNVVSGIYPATRGQVSLNGTQLGRLRPHNIVRRGAVRTFQNPQLFGDMTVRENVLTGMHGRFGASLLGALLGTPRLRAREAEALRTANVILARVGLTDDADTLASGLAYGKKRLLEVARCLAAEPNILILDEPAAGLSEVELHALSTLLKDLNRAGMTILLIEHHLAFLFSLVGAVTVLDHGEVIFDGTPDDARRDPRVIEAYLGSFGHA